ncbi:hypothetical protein CC79DRAFT_1322185 [Sarocladium strictum]
MSEATYNEEAGLLNQMADNIALSGDDYIPASEYALIPVPPEQDIFRFTKLPFELQAMIIGFAGPAFRENVSRLSISKWWYPIALKAMYTKLDASKMNHPFAPIDDCYERGAYEDGYWRAKEFCAFTANDEYRDHIRETLGKYVRELTVDLSTTFQLLTSRKPYYRSMVEAAEYITEKTMADILESQDLDEDAERYTGAVTFRNAMESAARRRLLAEGRTPRAMRRPFHGDHAPFETIEGREAVDRAAHAIQLLSFATQTHTLTINIRQAVVIELEMRSWWPMLDTIIAEAKVSRLFMDLVGLSEMKDARSQEGTRHDFWGLHRLRPDDVMAQFRGYADVDPDRQGDFEIGPLTVLDPDVNPADFDNLTQAAEDYDTGSEDGIWSMPTPHGHPALVTDFNMRHTREGSWPSRVHLCHAIREVLPNLEVLHYRDPTVCCSLFRAPTNHPDRDNDPALPKLKEVIINLVMPHNPRFARNRICHCMTGSTDLTFEKTEAWGSIAAIDMQEEIKKLLTRMDNPRRVLLRFPIRSQQSTTGEVLRRRAIEWDALTDSTRQILIDELGNSRENN